MSPNTLYTIALFVTFTLFILLAIIWGALMIAMYDRIVKFTAPSEYDSGNTLEEAVNTPTVEHPVITPADAWGRQQTWVLSRYPKDQRATVKVERIGHLRN